jgi:dinuclear metal center YbgI/SA1388 family protein
MNGYDIEKFLDNWAPKEISWQKDNVGLQIGNPGNAVKNILLCLEVTQKVIDDAIKKKCNFIISHHPFLFQPIKKIDLHKDKNSQLIRQLLNADITLYSAHTNLDFTKDGVSFQLAKRLELLDIRFLLNSKDNQVKLVVFVPEDSISKVSEAVFSSGGGIIGEYSQCSFRTQGTGTFKGSKKSNPKVGKALNFTETGEVKLEFLIDSWNAGKAVKNMLSVHPYEEPAYDIYPLKNGSVNYGEGAIGRLAKPMRFNDYLSYVAEKLKIKNFRYNKGKSGLIQTVAVCGGSGGELIGQAIKQNADSFVTADLKYHAFGGAENIINLIDAGHYETEIIVLDELKKRLEKTITSYNPEIKVQKFNGTTNTIFFYNK